MKQYDVIVIGAGGAGLSAAFTTAGFGKKTLLVERNKTGGECTWNGCIPSKALIHLAELSFAAKKSGFPVPPPDSLFDKVDKVRQAVYAHESPEVLAERGIETLIGNAQFTGPDRIEVKGETYQAAKFVLAVGSRALVPPIPGLAETPHLTNESLFELRELPESILVMGGGPIGVEMAQALSRLGAEVTVVEMLDRILFREDTDAAKVIEDQLRDEGIQILTDSRVIEVASRDNRVTLTVERQGVKSSLEANSLLVAIGRGTATEGLGLEAAGVTSTAKGVEVNKYLQTSNPRIYAAGDVAGPYAFSHMAEYQGVRAALNLLLPFRMKTKYQHVPWCTFTDPEIARTGMTESEARDRYGSKVHVYTHRFEDLDRGRTAPGTRGLVKIILGRRGRILGAHIAGPRAGELISEIQVLKTLGIGYQKLRGVIHPYPSYADILRIIAKKVAMDQLINNPMVRLIQSMKGGRSGR